MEIRVEKAIYSKEVLLKTAYSFIDRAYLHLSQENAQWIIQWTSKDDKEISYRDFENALIEQELREQLIREAADVRKLVLARAFASTIIDATEQDDNVVYAETENAEFSESDSILKGWFEQNADL